MAAKLLLSGIISHHRHVPSNYIRPISDRSNLSEVETSNASIPLIDLHGLAGSGRVQVVKAIGLACQNDGFFQVTKSAAAENTESSLREGDIDNPVALGRGTHDGTTQERGVQDLTQPALQPETEMLPNGTNHGPLPQGALEDEAAETQQQALKVAYCSMTISAPGVLTYVFGVNQIGQGHRLALNICALLLAATFVLAAFLIGLAGFRRRISYRSEIFNILKYMILGAMVLAILGFSYVFLKLLTLITTAPITVLLFFVFR